MQFWQNRHDPFHRRFVGFSVVVAMGVCSFHAIADDQQQRDDEAEAMRRMFQARNQDRQDQPAQTPAPARRANLPPLELKLSGNAVTIETLSTGEIVIIGNDSDLDILESFLHMIDVPIPEKDHVFVRLDNASAEQVAQRMDSIIQEIWPGIQDLIEQRISVIPVSSSTVFVVAPKSRVERVIEIIKAIDEVEDAIPEFETMKFFIKHRKAAEVADQLGTIISKLQAKQGATAEEEITLEVNDADNSIIVFGPQTLRDQIQRLIDQIDIEPVEGHGHVKLVLFPLINTTAEDLATVLTDMLASGAGQEGVQETIRRLSVIKREPDGTHRELQPLDLDKPLRILADKATNSLIIATVEENIEPISDLIEVLDSYPLGHEMSMKIFPLKFADATVVKETLDKMFDDGKKLPERAPGGTKTEAVPEGVVGRAFVYNINIEADARTNTVFVSGRPEQLVVAQLVVDQLDVPISEVKFPLRLLFLGTHLDATRVKSIVEDLFAKRIELLNDTDAGTLAIAREQVFLAVDVRSNAMIISASEQNYDEIERIAAELNVASDRLIDNIRIINCVKTSAADLAGKIDELWQRKAELRQQDDLPQDLPIIVPDQRSNAMVIASSPEDFEEIERLVQQLEAQELSPIAEIRLITLQHNDATEVATMLKTLFEERMEQRLTSGQEPSPTDNVAVATDAATNTMLIAASPDNYEEMIRIIEAIDIEPIIEGVVKIFMLENAEASDVADKVKDLFDQGLYHPAAGLDSPIAEARQQVAIISDARSNSIVVSASKTNLAIIENLIGQMDSELAGMLSDDTKIIALEFADAIKLADMLEQLFEGRQSEASEPDLFRKPTIIPDARSNTLLISSTRDALQRCVSLIAQLDRPSGPPTSTFEVYALEHGSAVKLAAKMRDVFEKRSEGGDETATPIVLEADEASNSLIASASRDDHVLIRGLLDLLDKPSSIARQFQIFPLKMAKADAVAETLDQLFQQQADGAGGRADAIAVQPDPRTNSLVVWGSASEMDNIRTIIDKLDTTEPAVEMTIKVIRLKQALANDFAEIFEQTLNGGDQGDNEAAVIVSFTETLDDGVEIVRKLVRQDITVTPDPRTNSLMVLAPSASMNMLQAMIEDFDKIKPVTAEIRIIPLINADAEEIVERLNDVFGTDEQPGDSIEQRIVFGEEGGVAVTGGDGGSSRQPLRFTADRRTNTVIASGNPIDLRMVEELVRELDSQDIAERVHEVYTARYMPAAAIADVLSSFSDAENELLSELDDEISIRRRAEKQLSVVSDEDSNTLILGASPRYFAEYSDLVRQIDKPEPQVMISVLIAEVSVDDRFELGVEFAAQDLNFSENASIGPNGVVQGKKFDVVAGTDIGAAGVGFGGLSLTVSGEDFSFLFRALQSEGQLEVLSRPTILVQNNAEGRITIGDRVPIISGTTAAGGQSSTQINYEEVGIILDVTPHINPDGYVTLEISPEISQISSQSLQVSEGLTAAVFSERSAETTVTVKDGETVILGGLITENLDESVVKVPFLGDLPWIGALFRSTTKISKKTELLIVLTVNVLRNESDLYEMSVKERDMTGRFPARITHSPLMGGLRILAEEEDAFGPVQDDELEPPGESRRPKRDRSIYGPKPRTYGPPRPTAQLKLSGAEPGQPVYGPRLVRSEP